MVISENMLNNLQERRQIKLPSVLFTLDTLKKMDQALETGNPFVVSKFYENYEQYIDKTAFKLIEEELNKPRNNLSDKDRELIKRITIVKDKDSEFLLEISGNLLYISNTLKELDDCKEISKNLWVSVLLYCCLNMIELFTSYIGELIKQRIELENKQKEYIDFLKKFDNNEHAEAGVLKNTLARLFEVDNSFMKETIFERNKILRNKISHANIFYDSNKDMIYQSNSKEYSLSQIKEDCSYLFSFLLEMIFSMNDNSNELVSKVDKAFKSMSRTYLNFSRAGMQRRFQQIIINMMK